MPDRYEAVLGVHVDGDSYEIESIPWFTYGLARFDVVEAMRRDEGLFIARIVRPSGHSTVRVGIADGSRRDEIHEQIHGVLEDLAAPSEWHAAGFVSVDISETGSESELLLRLNFLVNDHSIEIEIDRPDAASRSRLVTLPHAE
jgi:hypothetical protein